MKIHKETEARAVTKKEQARYRAIVRELDRIRRKGFARNDHPDIEILEVELEVLGNKFIAGQ